MHNAQSRIKLRLINAEWRCDGGRSPFLLQDVAAYIDNRLTVGAC